MTVPSDFKYDESVHSSVLDVAVDDPTHPSMIQITIKQSKTDPFRKGIDLYVGKTGSSLYQQSQTILWYVEPNG